MTWVEVEWKSEQLEQSIVELSKVMTMKERPFRTEDYSLKSRPVWYHVGTDSSVFGYPQQLAIQEISLYLIVRLTRYKYLIPHTYTSKSYRSMSK